MMVMIILPFKRDCARGGQTMTVSTKVPFHLCKKKEKKTPETQWLSSRIQFLCNRQCALNEKEKRKPNTRQPSQAPSDAMPSYSQDERASVSQQNTLSTLISAWHSLPYEARRGCSKLHPHKTVILQERCTTQLRLCPKKIIKNYKKNIRKVFNITKL